MHQCLMYNVLTSMNFFKYYIHGKARVWAPVEVLRSLGDGSNTADSPRATEIS